MKRYTIGLTLLFALMNTGCEDAKAESKDYDVEIAELQQQVSQLNSRLDSLIAVVPTNTNVEYLDSRLDSLINIVPTNAKISALSSRLDSTIHFLPKRKVYEITTKGGDEDILIPEIQINDMPSVTFTTENYGGNSGQYDVGATLSVQDGKVIVDSYPAGYKVIVTVIK